MNRLVKIAQIAAIDEGTKEYIAKRLENTGILIVDDPEYPDICYAVEEEKK